MSHVFHRNLKSPPSIAARGEGSWITDVNGKRYLDAHTGGAVCCIGYSHPRVVEAVSRQIATLNFAHGTHFTSEPLEALADRLVSGVPSNLSWVYVGTGGSEITEAAMKVSRQYWVDAGRPGKYRFIGREGDYHGATLGALAVGGNKVKRALYEPMFPEWTTTIPNCNPYRDKLPGETDEDYGLRAANTLEQAILAAGPETVAGFFAETVVGFTLGAVAPVPGYFKRIREICDRYDVLLILDEILCGLGRTGIYNAFEREGIVPDILMVGKGMGAGYQPIGAFIADRKIGDVIRDGTGAFAHGQAYESHPVACAAALAVLDVIRDENLVENVAMQGALLTRLLRERFQDNDQVGDVRGIGMLHAVELVQSRDTKQPFDADLMVWYKVAQACGEEGLLTYPLPGHLDGRFGENIMLAPPYNVSGDEIEMVVDRLGEAVDRTLAAL